MIRRLTVVLLLVLCLCCGANAATIYSADSNSIYMINPVYSLTGNCDWQKTAAWPKTGAGGGDITASPLTASNGPGGVTSSAIFGGLFISDQDPRLAIDTAVWVLKERFIAFGFHGEYRDINPVYAIVIRITDQGSSYLLHAYDFGADLDTSGMHHFNGEITLGRTLDSGTLSVEIQPPGRGDDVYRNFITIDYFSEHVVYRRIGVPDLPYPINNEYVLKQYFRRQEN